MSDCNTRKIKVLIADDQELVRSGYRAILSTYPDFEIVGMAKDGGEAVSLSQRQHPDVVLMDIRMPQMSGIEATREITSSPITADTRVLVLTTFDLDEYVFDALEAGASGFLLKDADPDELVDAIRIVDRGDALIQPSVMGRLVHTFAVKRPEPGLKPSLGVNAALDKLSQLTDREREILTLVARGLSNDQIGSELFISPATVKTHVARIMAKTCAHDRAQLVIFAYETGLVVPQAQSAT